MSETKQTTTPATALAAVKPPEEFERLLSKQHTPIGVFDDPKEFAHAQRVVKMLVMSQLMPEHFRGEENLGSAVIAVDIAFRLRLSPQLVAQQIYIVHGKPGFSAQFVIAAMNTNAKFGKLRYEVKDKGEKKVSANWTEWVGGQKQKRSAELTIFDQQCIAWTLDGKNELPTGINTLQAAREAGLAVLEGPAVTIEMAVKEGWYAKDGSKWPTMPGLMLRYRAATFFGRLYAPELTMGLPTVDELEDMPPSEPPFTKPVFGSTKAPESPPVIDSSPPEPTATPSPIPTPSPAEKTSPEGSQGLNQATLVPRTAVNPVTDIRTLCKVEGIKEEALIAFLKTIRSVKDNVGSLEEIQLSDNRVLGMVCEQWEEIAKRVKEAK